MPREARRRAGVLYPLMTYTFASSSTRQVNEVCLDAGQGGHEVLPVGGLVRP